MEGNGDEGLTDSILSTAASMKILADELDRISIHSSSGLQSSSRESLHSSSKYDSAFDSHYSEDTVSFNSQVVSISYPVDTETSILPSILTPPLPYRVASGRQSPISDRSTSKRRRTSNVESEGVNSSPSPSPLVTHQFRGGGQSSDPLARIHTYQHRTVSHLMSDSSLPTIHQAERIYVEPSPPTNEDAKPEGISATLTTPIESPSDLHYTTSPAAATLPPRSSDGEVTPLKPTTVLGADEACFLLHQRHLSESSSMEDLISNDSTPTVERRQPQAHSVEEGDEVPTSLSPRVTIVYPPKSDSDYSDDSPLPQRLNYFPRTGTLFYQESLTPQQSPLHVAHRHKSSTNTLPSRYQDSAHSSQSNGKSVNRSASILQRLKRKRGSFKGDSLLKRRLPVKRSLSDHVTYHIRKGWIDYAEDLDFISQPTHPRAVGRMIDKKAGKFHVVQLYKPANGRYGIYISQRGNRKGIFISRFANSTAEKFYAGLISPGDQIIRVNGRNIGQHSVDHVYDLMTASDSVIFTVIPVNFRSDW